MNEKLNILNLNDNYLLIQGGLGNQLLQSALFSKIVKNNVESSFISDYLYNSKLRKIRGVTPRKISKIFFKDVKNPYYVNSLIGRLFNRINFNKQVFYQNSISKVQLFNTNFFIGDGLNPIVFSPIFDSYWYEVIEILDKNFGYISLISCPIIHFRKGDYKKKRTNKKSFIKVLSLDYYLSSIKYLEKKYSQKIDKVFLISDEIKVAYKELSPFIKEVNYYDNSLVEYDLWLLSRSKNIIMSNSTLSCLGAHLAQLRGTLENCICPEKWFYDFSKNGSRYDLRKNKWKRI